MMNKLVSLEICTESWFSLQVNALRHGFGEWAVGSVLADLATMMADDEIDSILMVIYSPAVATLDLP